jgi:haloalkane dehalogenase
MEILHTPDECFVGLPDFPYAARYTEVTDADTGLVLRFAVIDEGPSDAPPMLLLHGNPSWSFLHRHMIRGLVERGHRVVALDLMGLGRSDKPDDPTFYTLARHVDWVRQWLAAEELTDITLYCQDWGGLIGLNVLRFEPDRFRRIIASNTGVPAGEGVTEFMQQWLDFSQSVEELPIGMLVASGVTRSLDPEEIAAYMAPFPEPRYQASAKEFPLLIPVQPDNPGVPMCRETWDFLATWTKPFLTVFGDQDPVAFKPGAHEKFQRVVPGAAGQPHRVLEGPNHFIQEDASDELVAIIDEFAKHDGGNGS